jgi:hypothetical protein
MTHDAEPTPSAVLDESLHTLILRTKLAQIGMTVAVVIALLVSLATAGVVAYRISTAKANEEAAAAIVVNNALQSVNAKIQASCSWYFDVGSVIPATSPSISKVGVRLLVDSRNAFVGAQCPGKLPRPSKALLRAASKFGISVRF